MYTGSLYFLFFLRTVNALKRPPSNTVGSANIELYIRKVKVAQCDVLLHCCSQCLVAATLFYVVHTF